MSRDKPEVTFTRRKFTITETLDDVLTDLAERNYQGNVSLCLRAAIEDHRTTLEGTSEGLVAQQLTRYIEYLQEGQDHLIASIKSIEDAIDDGTRGKSNPDHIIMVKTTDEMHRVHDVLVGMEQGLRVDDIAEQLEMPTSRVQPALCSLVDQGHVCEYNDNQRYRLAGYTATNSEAQE